MLAVLLACASPGSEAVAYRDALHDGRCEVVRDDALRDDCWLKWLDPEDATWCDKLTTERLRGECAFTMGERTHDAAWCGKAGPFADDCRLHLVSQRLADIPGAPGEAEATVAGVIAEVGLSPDDGRPWVAWYRWSLGRVSPLDRSTCAAVADAVRRDACQQAGLALFHDRLNNARDRRQFPCDGGPLPDLLVHAPDEELDRAIRNRMPELCPRR